MLYSSCSILKRYFELCLSAISLFALYLLMFIALLHYIVLCSYILFESAISLLITCLCLSMTCRVLSTTYSLKHAEIIVCQIHSCLSKHLYKTGRDNNCLSKHLYKTGRDNNCLSKHLYKTGRDNNYICSTHT